MNSLLKVALLIALALFTACNRTSPPPAATGNSPQSTTSAQRYHLKGRVVSIDMRAKMANINAEAIPGLMDAMTMPYPIKPEGELDKLQPGDLITGNVVVQDDNSWLENVTITSHAAVRK